MWIVAKYKPKEFKILKQSFSKILGETPEFYIPKIKYERYVNNKLKIYEKDVLTNYLICGHEKFKDHKFITAVKISRGLIHFLENFHLNQKELENFIKFCKSHEDATGFLKQSFFNITRKNKAKFISGPFTQMIFNIIEDSGSKLKILLNNVNVTVSKKTRSLLYSYI